MPAFRPAVLLLTPERPSEQTLGGYRGGLLLSLLVCWAQSSVGGCRLDKRPAARWRKNKDKTKRISRQGGPVLCERERVVGLDRIGDSDCIASVASRARPIDADRQREGGVETAPLSNRDLAQQRSIKPSHRICPLVPLSQKYLHRPCALPRLLSIFSSL